MYPAKPLVFQVIVHLGSCWAFSDLLHGYRIVSLKLDLKNYISSIPLPPRSVAMFGLANGPSFDGISERI